MAPATTSSAEARRFIGSRRRTEAPRRMLSPSPPPKKVKSMEEILAKARYAVVERGDYGDVGCEQCGSGERAEELLLCDKCDKGFHMKCLRPIVVRVPIGSWLCPKCSGQRRARSRGFFFFLNFFIFKFLFLNYLTQMWQHDLCFSGFSQKKIIDFFKIKKCNQAEEKCDSPQGAILIIQECTFLSILLKNLKTIIRVKFMPWKPEPN